MTARTARRISQPDCAPRAPSRTKNGAGTPRSPLALFHPRNALPRVPFAASIRKAGRILTAPLPPLQPWLFSTKNGVDAPLPLAQLHPRNALPRVSFAARIRKAGLCLTAPLARRHSRKSSEFRRIRVLPSANSQGQPKMASKAQKLIHGTAIKSRANRHRFSDLRISNRR